MSIRALRTLLAVHRHGSFRAAADAVNLTPAAVSQQMRHLEDTWNLQLFDRAQRTPKLTETGLSLVDEAFALLSHYDGLPDKLGAQDDMSGELVLGAVPTTLTGLVPLALSRLKIQHPGIRVRIVPGLSNQLLLQLERGQIHAAIVSRPPVLPKTMAFSSIAKEDLVLLVADGTEDRSPHDLLRDNPFIRFNRDAVVGRQIEAWLQHEGIVVNDAMELDGLEAISSMVAARLGISIVPQRCIVEQSSLPLKTIPLGENSPRRVVGLVSRADGPKAGLVRATQTALLEAVSIGVFALKP